MENVMSNSKSMVHDIDFAASRNEVVPATSNTGDGQVTAYAVKAYGRVISGRISSESIVIGEYEPFCTTVERARSFTLSWKPSQNSSEGTSNFFDWKRSSKFGLFVVFMA